VGGFREREGEKGLTTWACQEVANFNIWSGEGGGVVARRFFGILSGFGWARGLGGHYFSFSFGGRVCFSFKNGWVQVFKYLFLVVGGVGDTWIYSKFFLKKYFGVCSCSRV
jgi:hypothetical protein